MVTVAGETFKVKDDVVPTYEHVAQVLKTDSEDYLLAVILALYRTKNREKYRKLVTRGLLNEAVRPVLLSLVRFYKVYKRAEPRAREKIARSMRYLLDTVLD